MLPITIVAGYKTRKDFPCIMYTWGLDPHGYKDYWELIKASHRYAQDSFRVATKEELDMGLLNYICNDEFYPEATKRFQEYVSKYGLKGLPPIEKKGVI